MIESMSQECHYALQEQGCRVWSLKSNVLGLGWRIAMKPDGSVKVQSGDAILPAAQACCEAVLCQLDSLADCLEVNTFTDLPRPLVLAT